MIEGNFDQLRQLLEHFSQRESRARDRLARAGVHSWSFAIIGAALDVEELCVGKFGALRRVVDPPGEVELASALADRSLYGAIGRYSRQVRAELVLPPEFAEDLDLATSVGWWIVSAFRIRTRCPLFVPAVADRSWSILAAIRTNECVAHLLEDFPRAKSLGATPWTVKSEDCLWVGERVLHFAELMADPRFATAVEAHGTHAYHGNLRMSAAALWSGVESLMGITAELRFRIATMAAALLEPRGEARIARYRAVKKLYDVRSKAVHGSKIGNGDLEEHVRTVRNLLAELLELVIETGRIPSEDDLDAAVFG